MGNKEGCCGRREAVDAKDSKSEALIFKQKERRTASHDHRHHSQGTVWMRHPQEPTESDESSWEQSQSYAQSNHTHHTRGHEREEQTDDDELMQGHVHRALVPILDDDAYYLASPLTPIAEETPSPHPQEMFLRDMDGRRASTSQQNSSPITALDALDAEQKNSSIAEQNSLLITVLAPQDAEQKNSLITALAPLDAKQNNSPIASTRFPEESSSEMAQSTEPVGTGQADQDVTVTADIRVHADAQTGTHTDTHVDACV